MAEQQNQPGEAGSWDAYDEDMRQILRDGADVGRPSDLRVELEITYPTPLEAGAGGNPFSFARPEGFDVVVTDHGQTIFDRPFDNEPASGALAAAQ